MSTSSAHKHMAEDTAGSGKSGGISKGSAGSMGVSAGVGPAARAGSATAAGTAGVDGPSVDCIEAAAGVSREPELTCAADLDCCGCRAKRVGAEWLQPSPATVTPKIQDRVKGAFQSHSVCRRHINN